MKSDLFEVLEEYTRYIFIWSNSESHESGWPRATTFVLRSCCCCCPCWGTSDWNPPALSSAARQPSQITSGGNFLYFRRLGEQFEHFEVDYVKNKISSCLLHFFTRPSLDIFIRKSWMLDKANYVWSHTQCCSKSSFWDSGLTIANDFRMMHEQTTWSSSSSSSSLSPTTATSSSPPSTAADEQHQQHLHSGYGQYGENVQVKSEQEWFKDILNKLLAC